MRTNYTATDCKHSLKLAGQHGHAGSSSVATCVAAFSARTSTPTSLPPTAAAAWRRRAPSTRRASRRCGTRPTTALGWACACAGPSESLAFGSTPASGLLRQVPWRWSVGSRRRLPTRPAQSLRSVVQQRILAPPSPLFAGGQVARIGVRRKHFSMEASEILLTLLRSHFGSGTCG